MHLTHLSLANFRKYIRLELDLSPRLSLIYGANSQGKTNLLESIYFLATTRSPRASADRELINWLSLEDAIPFTRVACDLQRAERSLHLEVAMTLRSVQNGFDGGEPPPSGPAVAKRIRINNVARRASELIGQMNVVLFSPQDVDLVSGTPAGRRRYVDVAICQVDLRYLQSLQQYVKVLAQRNHLLRLIRDKRASADQLLFWNEQLVTTGSYILIQRWRCVEALAAMAADRLRKLTGEREHLSVLYASSVAGQRGTTAARWRAHPEDGREENVLSRAARSNDQGAVLSCFRDELAAALPREVAQGVSLVGPHRDDLQFLLDGHDATLFGSRGQQRAIALAMKLAESEYMREQTGERPILLLDDAFSELDESRRLRALTCIDPDQQVLITTTSVADYQNDLCAAASLFEIEDAQVRQHCRT